MDFPPHSAAPGPHPPAPLLVFDLPRPQVIVRRLQRADVRLLEWHGGPDLRSFYEWQWERHQDHERCVLVADFNGYPIGQLAVHWQGKPTHPGVPDIQSFRVLEVFRGQGIGTRLLAVAERLVTEQGFAQATLAVGVDNAAARRLYERLGYHATGQPYPDAWSYTNAQGQIVSVREMVLDLIKDLR